MKRPIAFKRGLPELVLLLVLAGCGGGSGGGGSGGDSRPGSKLFVADGGNLAIGSVINSNPGAGTSAVDRIIQGPSTKLGTGFGSSDSIPSIIVDAAADRLFVAAVGLKVLVFDQAGFASGDVAPSRAISGFVNKGGTNFGVGFHHLSFDAAANVLYTVDTVGEVHIFNSGSALSGTNVTPNRTIIPDLGGPSPAGTFGIAIDATVRNMLYVGVNSSTIAVFNNASAADTTPNGPALAPNRTLNLGGATSSFYLDTVNDRLYAAVNTEIRVFDNASTLASGTVTPSRPPMNLGVSGWFITVEPAGDRLYAVRNNTVVIIANASTAQGNVVGTILTVPAGFQFGAVAVKP